MASSLTPPSYSKTSKRLFWLPRPTCEQPSSSASPPFPVLYRPSRPTDCAGKPLQLTSTGNSQACLPLSLHCWTRSWYLMILRSEASIHPSSQGIINSVRMIFLASSDHMTASGPREVWTTRGKWSLDN